MAILKDETGKTYGYLTVVERDENDAGGRARWKCKCKCGNEIVVSGKSLRNGNTKSCGCYQKERAAQSNMDRAENLIGKRFGRLVVLEEEGFYLKPNGRRARLYRCKCDCGNICKIQHQYLAFGDTSSCGCINSVGNMTINRLLNQKGCLYKTEYSFNNFCTKNGGLYRYDFAIFSRDNKLLGLIEYQGDIHFSYHDSGWNNKENFQERILNDKIKKEYCDKNNIKLFYITYLDDIQDKLEEILSELQC